MSAACPSFARVEAATLTSRYGASHCSLRPGLAIARLATLLRCVTSRSRGDCLDRRSFPSCPRGAALQGATAGCRYACGRLALGFLRVDCYPAYRYDHPSLSFRSNAAGQIKLLEVNPNPAWCWDGKLAHMGELAHLSHSDVLARIIAAAERRVAAGR